MSATPMRTIRIADDLWQAAQTVAATKGVDASTTVRVLLLGYVLDSGMFEVSRQGQIVPAAHPPIDLDRLLGKAR